MASCILDLDAPGGCPSRAPIAHRERAPQCGARTASRGAAPARPLPGRLAGRARARVRAARRSTHGAGPAAQLPASHVRRRAGAGGHERGRRPLLRSIPRQHGRPIGGQLGRRAPARLGRGGQHPAVPRPGRQRAQRADAERAGRRLGQRPLAGCARLHRRARQSASRPGGQRQRLGHGSARRAGAHARRQRHPDLAGVRLGRRHDRRVRRCARARSASARRPPSARRHRIARRRPPRPPARAPAVGRGSSPACRRLAAHGRAGAARRGRADGAPALAGPAGRGTRGPGGARRPGRARAAAAPPWSGSTGPSQG